VAVGDFFIEKTFRVKILNRTFFRIRKLGYMVTGIPGKACGNNLSMVRPWPIFGSLIFKKAQTSIS
jgi:hypothetical protein